MKLQCYMRSCAARESLRRNTLTELSRTDFAGPPTVELDDEQEELVLSRQSLLVVKVLQRAISEGAELILLLEDDLLFNKHLSHNIHAWHPVRELGSDRHFFASLCNFGVSFDKFIAKLAYGEAHPSPLWAAKLC